MIETCKEEMKNSLKKKKEKTSKILEQINKSLNNLRKQIKTIKPNQTRKANSSRLEN